MRDIRTMNMSAGQKIESDLVMKRIGDLAYRDLGVLAKMSLFDSGKALIVGSGLRVVPSSGMTVKVPSGSVFQRCIDVYPCLQTEDQLVTMDAASGVPRVDIVEAQVKVIADRSDIVQVASVGSGSSVIVTTEEVKRDIQYYLSVRKQTGTTTPTPATAGILTGLVAIPGTIDLSAKYLLNLMDGEDGDFMEIDCHGATPEATTRAEIIAAINTAVGRTIASAGAGNVIILTGSGTGQTSVFVIKPPLTDPDKDCLQVIFGISVGGTYIYNYAGVNEWFKLAEIDIGIATTIITTPLIRNIDEKSTWGDGADILLFQHLFNENVYLDSITEYTAGHGVDIIDNIHILDTTESTTKDTGSIITEGGIGVEKNISAGGNLNISGNYTLPLKVTDVTDSTTKDTGSIITEGGIGVEKTIAAGGKLLIADVTDSTTKDTGSIITEGGIGVEKTLVTGGKVLVKDTTESTTKDTGCAILEGGLGVEKTIIAGLGFSGKNKVVNSFYWISTDTENALYDIIFSHLPEDNQYYTVSGGILISSVIYPILCVRRNDATNQIIISYCDSTGAYAYKYITDGSGTAIGNSGCFRF
jgi:hypothetical protein